MAYRDRWDSHAARDGVAHVGDRVRADRDVPFEWFPAAAVVDRAAPDNEVGRHLRVIGAG